MQWNGVIRIKKKKKKKKKSIMFWETAFRTWKIRKIKSTYKDNQNLVGWLVSANAMVS